MCFPEVMLQFSRGSPTTSARPVTDGKKCRQGRGDLGEPLQTVTNACEGLLKPAGGGGGCHLLNDQTGSMCSSKKEEEISVVA